MATYTKTNFLSGPKKITLVINDLVNGSKYKKNFFSWTNVAEVMKFNEAMTGLKVFKQRLFHKNIELNCKKTSLEDLIEEDDENTISLTLKLKTEFENDKTFINIFTENQNLSKVIKAIKKIKIGFNIGLKPMPCDSGVNGNYFMRNGFRKEVAIFKPIDEEAYAPNNPKGYCAPFGSKSFRNGILSGESATREVAAFILDDKHMHRVPETTFVEIRHPFFIDRWGFSNITANEKMVPFAYNDSKKGLKYGSLQLLVENDGESSDFSYTKFSTEDVHAIATLDIRILNCDRNDANILVKVMRGKKGYVFSLTPIDHGLSLPDNLDICDWELCWTTWPQIKKPFSKRMLKFIMSLEPKKNAAKLRKTLKIREKCLRNFRVSEILLQHSAVRGMTIFDITKMLYKDEHENKLSLLEKIVEKAEIVSDQMKKSLSKNLFMELSLIQMKKKKGMESSEEEKEIKTHTLDYKMKDFLELKKLKNEQNEIGEICENDKLKLTKNISNDSPFLLEKNDILELDDNWVPNSSVKKKRCQSVFYNTNGFQDNHQLRLKPIIFELELKKMQSLSSKKQEKSKPLKDKSITKVNFPSPQITKNQKNTDSPKKLKRSISNPNLKFDKEKDEKMANDISKEGIDMKKKKTQKKEKVWDDMFFYYYENFLDQTLDRLLNANLVKRERANSIFIQ